VRARFPQIPRSVQWALFAVATSVIAIVWLSPRSVSWVNGDLVAYQRTVDLMRGDQGYYPAMTQALRETSGPPSTVAAYRTPTIFWLWRWTGLSWPLVFVVIVSCGVLVGILSWPLAGLGVMFWLVVTAFPPGSEQWGYQEPWAVLALLFGLLALRHERWDLAALAILVAALVRETAVLALAGGLVGALWFKRPAWPWLAGLTTWFAFMAWHATKARPFLTDGYRPGSGAVGIGGVMDMAGVWLGPIGIIIVLAALWRARFSPDWFICAPILVVVPLAGLIIFRPYWSWLCLPIAVALLGARPGTTTEERGARRTGCRNRSSV
jgi:hypothetical protein